MNDIKVTRYSQYVGLFEGVVVIWAKYKFVIGADLRVGVPVAPKIVSEAPPLPVA